MKWVHFLLCRCEYLDWSKLGVVRVVEAGVNEFIDADSFFG